MVSYLVRRALMGLGTLWALSIISFVIIQLPPGDYVTSYVAQLEATGNVVTQQEAENMRRQYGLNRPMYVQYAKWMGRMVRGNFGFSMEWQQPVKKLIGEPLLLTVVLVIASLLLTWIIAFPISIYSAVRQYSIGDYTFTFLGLVGIAIPRFLLALIVMYTGFRYLGINVGGLFSSEYVHATWSMGRVWDLLKHLWLPAIILASTGTGRLIRIMRANLLDELRKPYVLTARARGLSEWHVVLKYPVRLALNPFVSTLGQAFPLVMSGSIIISVVLSLPTVGPLLLRALIAQDMFLAGTIILLTGLITVVGTLVSDILLVWIDPRIRMTA